MTKAQDRIKREGKELRAILEVHPEVRREVERAYRRGYTQAAYLTLKYVNEGHKPAALQSWYEKVFNWRCNLNGERVPGYLQCYRLPPEMPVVKGEHHGL